MTLSRRDSKTGRFLLYEGTYAERMKWIARRFWSKVSRRGRDECWPWVAATRHRFGYGYFSVPTGLGGGKRTTHTPAHRIVYELHSGRPIPSGMVVMHTCDNPACCNPRHLVLGSQADNLRDMRLKGRGARGERSGQAKLTEKKVLRLRALSERGVSTSDLAAKFGITSSAVSLIVARKRWVHV